jgi:putative transposase
MSSGVYNKYTGYHNRRSIRLPGYDYSRLGYYFVTMCIHDRKQKLFGDVVDNRVELNDFGCIVRNEMLKTEQMRANIKIDQFTIMPNHVHVIINIHGHCRGTLQRAPTEQTGWHCRGIVGSKQRAPTESKTERFGKPTSNSIPTIIRLIKSTITKQINLLRNSPSMPVWQRNYYEHVIRDENSLYFIRKYIQENPANWTLDHENHIDREIRDFEMLELEDAK